MNYRLICAILMLTMSAPLHAQTQMHGLSLFGAPQLPAGFAHFPYVNPNAPKTGEVRIAGIGNFNNLNPFTIKGVAASGLGMMHDTLLAASLDEPSAAYALIAKTISHPPDFSSVTFTLHPKARFSDGRPIRAEDVAFSLEALREAHPFYRAYYANVKNSEIIAPRTIRFIFNQTGNRELPLILGQLPILSKNYWTAAERSLKNTTLDIPVVSGAYKIEKLEAGRSITYQKQPDYWARNLNVSIGKHNFATIKYIYFGDDTVAFEALKAGTVHFREEFSSRLWAVGYDTPAIADGTLKRETITLENSAGMQAFVFNTRRARFADARVREALNWAYDFEWTNKNLFYGQYARTGSFFEASELAATGLPSADELKLLEPLRAQIPARVFTTPFKNPVSDGSGNIRAHLRKAIALLKQAGWTIQNGALTKDGEIFEIEFLLVQPAFERIVAPYIKNLARLGIRASIRTIDPTQYQNRVNHYDFDAVVWSFGQSLSPGNEQRDYWSSMVADRPGGRNIIGIKNKAIDQLLEKLIFATSRRQLVAAAKALDRVLLANHYVVPQWHAPYQRLAYWQGLAHPDPMPKYGLGFPAIWWRTAPHKTP